MLSVILTNKWKLSGILILITLGTAGVLWYQNDIDSKAELGVGAPVESTVSTTEKQQEAINDGTNDSKKPDTVSKPAAFRSSSYGFGTLPKVPPDYPDKGFRWRYFTDDPIFELIARVRLKIWNEQKRYAIGASFMHGRIYPIFQDTVYVRRETIFGQDGKEIGTFIKEVLWDSEYEPSEKQWQSPLFNMSAHIEKVINDKNLKVLDFDDAGIDPYSFLKLDKEKTND